MAPRMQLLLHLWRPPQTPRVGLLQERQGQFKKRERPLQGGELVRTSTPQHDSDPPHQPHHTFGYMTDHATTLDHKITGHQSRQATNPMAQCQTHLKLIVIGHTQHASKNHQKNFTHRIN